MLHFNPVRGVSPLLVYQRAMGLDTVAGSASEGAEGAGVTSPRVMVALGGADTSALFKGSCQA